MFRRLILLTSSGMAYSLIFVTNLERQNRHELKSYELGNNDHFLYELQDPFPTRKAFRVSAAINRLQ